MSRFECLIAGLLLVTLSGCRGSVEGDYHAIVGPGNENRESSGSSTDVSTPTPRSTAPTRVGGSDDEPGIRQVAATVDANVADGGPRAEMPTELASTTPGPQSLGTGVDDAHSEGEPPATAIRAVKSLVPVPEFKRENGALRITFDDLDLNRVIGVERPTMETPELMPAWQRELSGRRVRIRGFMYPVFEPVLSHFILTRDNGICCFGPEAKLYDQITVSLKPGTTTEYIQNVPFDVEGTFAIQPYEIGGSVVVYYVLEDAAIVKR